MKDRVAVGFNNGIGNFIMFTPVLQLIVNRVGAVDLFLDNEWEGEQKEAIRLMAKNMPFINNVIDYGESSQLTKHKMRYMSRHGRVDKFFQAVNDHLTDWTKLPSWAGSLMHEIEFYVFEASDVLGISPAIYPQYMPIGKKPKGLPDRYAVMSNGYLHSIDHLWDKKSWPHWDKFIKTFLSYYDDIDIVLVGGEDDKEWANQTQEIDDRIINKTGATTILETAAIIKDSLALISTDTAVMHIADALKVKGVTLFGPSLVSKNIAWNGTILPVRSTVDCSPCQGCMVFAQCQDYKCMERLKTEMVMAAVRKILM